MADVYDHPPCCATCEGNGATREGPCWDCRGTGHSHAPVVPGHSHAPVVPDWFKKTMPPFLDSDEVWNEYRDYLKTVAENQWHGVTVDDQKIVLRERVNPITSTMIEPSNMITYAWGTTEINAEPSVQVVALSYRILESVLPHNTYMGLEARLTEAFARLIVGRLPAAEWRLTDAFILQWCSIYREKYLS